MQVENIIILILIFYFLYLMGTCTYTENFSDQFNVIKTIKENNRDKKQIKLGLVSENNKYRLISYYDLKDEYKYLFYKQIINTDIDNRFFTKAQHSITNINEINPYFDSRTPILIIQNENLNEYVINSNNIMTAEPLGDFELSPKNNTAVFYDVGMRLLYYGQEPFPNRESIILSAEPKTNQSANFLLEIKNPSNVNSKLSGEIETEKINGKSLKYFSLSDKGSDFIMRWYNDDFSVVS